ncbi:MAG: shikimate dehydrogenase [Oscillospiraceae bacterium]|nr:shikimate dehydrogenase [Oscillospiraceae bacterium]
MEKYTLIGHPLGHSMSPFIHSKLFEASGIDAEYSCTDIDPGSFSEDVVKLKEMRGYNITIPYKTQIIPFIDKLDSSAQRYNSVNCVFNDNNTSIGYNTDCDGFLKSVSDMGLSEKVLLFGCGGVGRMMAIEAALHGAQLTIAILPQVKKTADILVEEILSCAPDCKVTLADSSTVNDRYNLIINATPVGMYPNCNASPASQELIQKCDAVFDAVYNPVQTQFVKTALSLGKKGRSGTAMLVWQAVRAHEIWNGSHYSEEQINSIIDQTNIIIEGDFR